MREVELSLNGTLREIFSFGESRGAFDRFLPSMCVMAEAQRYRPPLGIKSIILTLPLTAQRRFMSIWVLTIRKRQRRFRCAGCVVFQYL